MGLFGPSKKEVWEQLSKEIQVDYIDGGIWTGSKVKAHVGFGTYTVSTEKTSTTYTRIRATTSNKFRN